MGKSKGLFKQLKEALTGRPPCREIQLTEPFSLRREGIRLTAGADSLALRLGKSGKTLHLVPELPLDQAQPGNPPTYLLVEPQTRSGHIHGFLRLSPADQLVLGREDPIQQAIFAYPDAVADQHLEIEHTGDALQLRDLSEQGETLISPLPGNDYMAERLLYRRQQLREIRNIYGGPIEALDPVAALETLRNVNQLLEMEPLRPKDQHYNPGGVVRLPDKMTPIIIGDLHAQVNNLLTLLSQNEFLEALGDGTAAILFLGDAVHKEMDGEMEEMETSLLIMDLIFRLKIWFPQQVFYVRGNHDCFSEDVGKGGIPQGLLWDRKVRQSRGEEYKREMDRFYDLVPYVALSKDFFACHAAPPKSKVTMDLLVNARHYPGLIRELTCNRLYSPNRPAGYTKGDVKRLRNGLDMPKTTDMFVGHTPLDRTDTLWSDVAGIPNHHVVFSGNLPWIGVFTRIQGQFVPLRYRCESLLPLVNEIEADQ